MMQVARVRDCEQTHPFYGVRECFAFEAGYHITESPTRRGTPNKNDLN